MPRNAATDRDAWARDVASRELADATIPRPIPLDESGPPKGDTPQGVPAQANSTKLATTAGRGARIAGERQSQRRRWPGPQTGTFEPLPGGG
jgi:hypothetical protein